MFNFRVTALGLAATVLLGGTALSVTACREKGPMQKAGEKLDSAKEKVEDTINPKGPVEKAGRKLDKAVDDLKD